MGPWDVLEPFCTRNRYLNAFRCNFKQFQNFRFFGNFHVWDPQKWARRNFYECRNFEKMLKTGLEHHKHHHNKFAADNSTSFWKRSKKCEKKSKSRFCLKIDFFMQVLFLLRLLLFLLLKCCLSKSSYSDLHFDYPSFSHISYSLRVILDWKFFFEKNLLLLTFVRNFHIFSLSPHMGTNTCFNFMISRM